MRSRRRKIGANNPFRLAYLQLLEQMRGDVAAATARYEEIYHEPPPRDLEQNIQAEIVRLLTRGGCLCVVHDAGTKETVKSAAARAGRVPVGYPDMTVYAGNGVVILLEVKTATNKPTAAQVQWHSRLAEYGIPCAIVRSAQEAYEVVTNAKKVFLENTGGKNARIV